MNRTGSLLVALLLAMPVIAHAQGLMSGTGLQPSTQLATPPSAPAIDQPGAAQRARAQQVQQVQRARSQRMHVLEQPGATSRTAPATTTPW